MRSWSKSTSRVASSTSGLSARACCRSPRSISAACRREHGRSSPTRGSGRPAHPTIWAAFPSARRAFPRSSPTSSCGWPRPPGGCCRARGTVGWTCGSTTRAACGSWKSTPIPISTTTPACPAWRARPAGITPNWCAVSPRSRCAKRRAPRLPVSSSLRPVGRAQRARLEQLTAATGLFRPAEIAAAAELLDDSLAGDDDYRLLGAYGAEGTYDLYWIVVDPARQGQGVGTELLTAVEQQLAREHGRLLVVETSSRPDYASTRAFYERRGYARVATIPGYYAPGDDLVIYLKDLTHGVLAAATA